MFNVICSDLGVFPSTDTLSLFKRYETFHKGWVEYSDFIDCMHEYVETASTCSAADIRFNKGTGSLNSYGYGRSISGREEDQHSVLSSSWGMAAEAMPVDLVDMTPVQQQWRVKLRAARKLVLGLALIVVFSAPIIDVLNEIGKRLVG